MSDNIPPFDLQKEIIKKVSNVKSLLRFRSVSKPWKSFIDSSHFINGYGARNTHPHSHILSYKSNGFWDEEKYICLVEDESFKVQQQQEFVLSPLLKHHCSIAVGACHGLVCVLGFHTGSKAWMLVIWNPSIGKSFGILDPSYHFRTSNYAFGVCPVTKDPIVVKIIQTDNKPWHAEVFTLSSRVWNVIPSCNLPHESIRLDPHTQVVIDRFIYWGAYEKTDEDEDDDDEAITNPRVVSFDLITKEFKVVDLPDSLKNELAGRPVAIANLKESLVVYVDGAECCDVWVMECDSSFRKLFTIGEHVSNILGFSKSGEPVYEIDNEGERHTTLNVYNPCSQQIKNLGIFGLEGSFFMGSYKESLLLLDHSDSDLHLY